MLHLNRFIQYLTENEVRDEGSVSGGEVSQ